MSLGGGRGQPPSNLHYIHPADSCFPFLNGEQQSEDMKSVYNIELFKQQNATV